MIKRLHILHLEDEPDFAELVRSMLAQDKLEADVKQVGNAEAFIQALDSESFDLIISDYHLPSFTGMEAMTIARQRCPHTPFILVSGTIGEQAAIESLKAGATDYVLKQYPERLPSAVRRAVHEAEERAKLREAEMELVRREKYFRTLTENALDILTILSAEGIIIYKSPSVQRVLGYEPAELIGQNIFARIHPDDRSRVISEFRVALTDPDKPVKFECRYMHKNGSWRYLEAIGQNRLADPEILGLVVNSRDVTDRWRAEEDLRKSEKQYRLLFEGNPNPMWVFDLESLRFLEVNEVAIQHYGYSREEFLAMTIWDVRPPEKSNFRPPSITDESERGLIWKHRRKDGTIIEMEVSWSPIAFRGRFAALTTATDVTERRLAEHRNAVFYKLGHRLSSATTASEAAFIICDAADALFKWDDFALDLFNPERDEIFSLLNIATVEGQRVEIPSSTQPKAANALFQRVISKGAELISSAEAQDHYASTMLAPIRKGQRVIGMLFVQSRTVGSYTELDLQTLQTLADQCGGALERVNVEQDLRESQRRFRDLFESSPDAVFVQALDGQILDVNFAACVLCGLTRDQLINKNAWTLIPQKWVEEARRNFEKLSEQKHARMETEVLTSDGRTSPVEVRAARVEYSGTPALLLHMRDITERRSTETALHSSEMLFRSVWENSADGMRLTDENGTIIAVNDAYCKLVGLASDQLEGQSFTVVYAPSEDTAAMAATHREHFLSRAAERKVERQCTLHNGETVTLEITDSFIELHGQPLLSLSLFRDVTTQRRLEEQLRQSQKMEAIGQLAGGVAHDFNNILTVIHGHASLLLISDLDDSAARSAQQITQAAERAAGLTRQLLAFSRRQLIQPKCLDMNKIVGNMTDMLGRLLGEDIALQVNYCHSIPMVDADLGMIEQVLLNLAVNARDAMPKGGQLAVRISIMEINEAHVQRHPDARAGRFVCLAKTDTGCGIPQENLQRIFEPFFTTKDVGRGTGLGLATVYGIVKQHQGWIEVDSAIGKGTTFRIFLPYVGSESAETERPTRQITVRGGSETILLVEDERPVRELVARVLQKYGYKILQAGSGLDAVGVWREYRSEINLLLTDLIMPGNMNGRELAEQLWKDQPELKVIFSSGYSADIVGKDFKLDPELNYLQKPYHPQTLALTVRKCLDGRPLS